MGVNPSLAARQAEPDRPAPGRVREARANDLSVLIAAKEIFAERGLSAPMSAIAERAGVGVGSLYRRYPSKEALAQALRIAAMDQICEIAEDSIEQVPAEQVFARFLDRYLADSFGPLVSVLGGRVADPPEVLAAADRMRDALQRVVDVAREYKQIPEDYGPTDIVVIIVHLRGALPGDPATVARYTRRLLEPLLAGLRVMASSGRAHDAAAAPQWDEWLAFWSGRQP
ncbi:TetR/AcrR family transcriptional regulator [Planotetraspora kaengkrachanensis]|uniref:TetR family transcriptional regulator n=1 Tax=Planotetraspora kaengkrachanensis TaxID=575193 RepID=A0A8J3Q0G3_9ACTN|nr:TetR/AcrR family transcriptional regulator [Planotetraspora kaengkrachanensis]GIG84526.1 TetR family transcriptional regulator [Planotetraspora kaengkrachanensis]